ncbi:Spc24 subunit of Ndc80-domain-containing protein [Whalleya microplaca]|nr:Spc24 subunit of Ndc80-domain-containing protein [Whalleya microplaca]
MLLDEDPATLIHHTINNFNIAPDKIAISRVHDSLSTLKQARELRVRDAESALKKLSRNLNTLHAQYEELTSAHSSSTHASEISRLDTQKFRIAKATSDLEMEAERLSSQQADLAARLQELELQGLDGPPEEAAKRRDPVEDEVLLRLKVYRSLGIDLERDEKDGEFAKAVVRNDRKGDVHVVNMDKKFSRFFYANYFWQTL